ncbi:hypothetical protein Raf01_70840 [Rugosimonospora africana]|uniref:Uncharacterized protein n=1 Tax=Rugosimonospora africana TaxID=556532 RepID=A0A8J3VTY7_9ACTN|nr:hypothetical protein Raf01_70840 [Rugosimonospora africana]
MDTANGSITIEKILPALVAPRTKMKLTSMIGPKTPRPIPIATHIQAATVRVLDRGIRLGNRSMALTSRRRAPSSRAYEPAA